MLNHDLYAIDATPARWSGVVVHYRSYQWTVDPTHCLIYAQVNGGSIFDNILVTDDKKYADKMAEKTWKKIKGEEGSGEKEAKEAWKKENEPEEEPEDEDDEDDDEEEEHDEL